MLRSVIKTEAGKKKWKELIKKVIISLINMVINIYIIIKIFDISLLEFMQYMIVIQMYKIYGIIIIVYNVLNKKKVKYYNINSFIYYPYFYTIFLLVLLLLKFDFCILNINIVKLINYYYLVYLDIISFNFHKGILLRMGEEVIIKW